MTHMNPKSGQSQTVKSLILGGLLPIVAYTVVEETWGISWGLVFGMGLGVCEIIYELLQTGTVSMITYIGNGLILVMGGISFFTQDGVWFKMQPAIIEAVMGIGLMVSSFWGKSLLVVMAEKQGVFSKMPSSQASDLKSAFSGLTIRLGIFFLANAVLAAYAALYWSTRDWAILKGVGFTLGMFVYLIIEVVGIRVRLQARRRGAVGPHTPEK